MPGGKHGRHARFEKPDAGDFPRRLRVGSHRRREETEDEGDEEFHSITSSARTRIDCGIVRPSALAVLRLMISSKLVGCATASSPGLAPLRILWTYTAARRYSSRVFGPYI